MTIALSNNISVANLRSYNAWVDLQCSNLHSYAVTLGSILCLSPPGGKYVPGAVTNNSVQAGSSSGYYDIATPVRDDAIVAPGTSVEDCGAWHIALANDTCASICTASGITVTVLAALNPSINTTQCAASIISGATYCVRKGKSAASVVEHIYYSDRGCWMSNLEGSLPMSSTVELQKSTLDPPACVAYCRTQQDVTTDSGSGIAGMLGGDTCLCAPALSLDAVRVLGSHCATPCAGDNPNNYTPCGGDFAVQVLTYSTDNGYDSTLTREIADYGCYTDSGNNIGGLDQLTLKAMTRGQCRVNCLLHYVYYAVGNGTVCYCGNGLGSGTAAVDDQGLCSTPCGGNETENCGGDGYLNLFGTSSQVP